jgi:hypothetical protein
MMTGTEGRICGGRRALAWWLRGAGRGAEAVRPRLYPSVKITPKGPPSRKCGLGFTV